MAIKVEMMIRLELLSDEVISLSRYLLFKLWVLFSLPSLPRKTTTIIITLFLRYGQLHTCEEVTTAWQLEYRNGICLLSSKNYRTFPFSCSFLREHTPYTYSLRIFTEIFSFINRFVILLIYYVFYYRQWKAIVNKIRSRVSGNVKLFSLCV